MSSFSVEILQPSGKIIEIVSSTDNTVSETVVENYSVPNIYITDSIVQLPSDFNDRIFAVVSGDIIGSTGVSVVASNNKIYLSSIINASSGISLSHSSGSYTISTTGLQPTGNYSVVGHSHIISDVSGLQSALDSKQPSGQYAPLVHDHISSDITNFNSSVSGLLPVKNIISGTNISVINNNAEFTVAVTGQLGLTNEDIDDRVNSLLVAGTGILLSYNDNLNSLTINTSGLQPSGNYANSSHTHTSNDIIDFNSSVSGLSPSVSGSGYVSSVFSNNSYLISVTGLQPSGNYSTVDHTHTSSNIIDFNSTVSGLLPITSINAGSYINLSQSGTVFTVSATGLQPSGNYASSSHTHTSSNISDFNSAVSGLLPVKSITNGSGIIVNSSSGNYTIALSGISATSLSGLNEAIDDRVNDLLIEGTGVQLTYNDSSNTLTLDNLHTEINILSFEPQGFVNRLDSSISFNDSTRTFTIQPTGSAYTIYIEGSKVIKNTTETVVIGTGTSLNYIHFDTTTGQLQTKTTAFDFDTDVPIAFIHWNSDINQSTFFGEERHGIRMDSMTHKWIHNTFGMQYIDGLSIGGYTLLGDGSSDTHAQINISNGTLYQEDIIINIADGNDGIEFTQQLDPIAYIPVYYHSGSTGQWVRDASTAYPLKYNGTRALYNLYSGGTWTTPNVTNNRYFAMWIIATNDINDPLLAIMGQREDSSLTSAETNNNWSDVNLTNIPTNEIRPLYRLIFVTNDTFINTPKSSLQTILDLRKTIISTTYGIPQNDHGSLFGLGDDDHYQYIHINNSRTINANHTFSNGLTISSGLLNATSGNFTSLSVNSTGVSLSGHSHTSSNISNFNNSVSGLLPTISGSGYVSSIFSNNSYLISVTGLQPSGNYADSSHTHTSSNITDFNSSVSGLLTSYQQILTNPVTGTGIANHVAYWNSSSGIVADSGQLYWDSTNDRLGIGTATPASTLEVVGNIQQKWTGSDTRFATIYDNSYRMGINYAASQRIMQIFSTANVDSGGHIAFLTRFGAGSSSTDYGTERMRVTNSGLVGIGTTAPSGRLDVNGNIYIGTAGAGATNIVHVRSASYADNTCRLRTDANGNLFLDAGAYVRCGSQDGRIDMYASSQWINIGNTYDAGTANQYVRFVPANIEMMRVTKSGIGIGGITSPVSRLHISGIITQSPVHAIAGLSTDQTITSSSDTIVQLTDKDDPNNWWNASTYRFLPTVSGYYFISAQVNWDPGGGNGQLNIQLRRNGTTVAIAQHPMVTGVSFTETTTTIVNLNGSTDYVDLTAYTSSTAGSQIINGTADQAWTKLEAYKIS
jgi:hypothetical protein